MVAAIREDGDWIILEQSELASAKHLVYAFVDHREVVFRIGKTSGRLKQRLDGYRKVTRSGVKLRKNEMADGVKMRECTAGKPFTIWAKAPTSVTMVMENGLQLKTKSLLAEEIFWICYFRPRFGNKFE